MHNKRKEQRQQGIGKNAVKVCDHEQIVPFGPVFFSNVTNTSHFTGLILYEKNGCILHGACTDT